MCAQLRKLGQIGFVSQKCFPDPATRFTAEAPDLRRAAQRTTSILLFGNGYQVRKREAYMYLIALPLYGDRLGEEDSSPG
jgi:hypothetical protein